MTEQRIQELRLIISKLERIQSESELEQAVIRNIISNHLKTIHEAEFKKSSYVINNYTHQEYQDTLDSITNKINKGL